MYRSWKYAASLILTSRLCSHRTAVLMIRRDGKNRHLPDTDVFPGGGVEEAHDFSASWWPLLNSAGASIDELISPPGKKPITFREYEHNRELRDKHDDTATKNHKRLPPEVGFRLAALRETFEETGVLLVRPCGAGGQHRSNQKTDVLRFEGQVLSSDLAEKWRSRVQNDATELINMSVQLEMVPDIWSLYEWSSWLTPSHLKKRHDTVFFITSLPGHCQHYPLRPDLTETSHAQWVSAAHVLTDYMAGTVSLMPPQLYELGRLVNFKQWRHLDEYIKQRTAGNMTRHFPVLFKLSDGHVIATLPGDDLYPENPDFDGNGATLTHEQATRRTANFHRFDGNKNFICTVSLPDHQIIPTLRIDSKL